MVWKSALLTLWLSAAAISARRMLTSVTTASPVWCIPDVDIQAYQPKGFKVSIPHEDGVQMFAFHASINKRMKNYEVGQYFKDVMYPVNGRWEYQEKSAKLKVGDTIYFWVYVLHNKLGYRKDDQIFKVTELITDPFPEDAYYPSQSLESEAAPQYLGSGQIAFDVRTSQVPLQPTPIPPTNDECRTNLTTYERIIVDNSHKIYSCQVENAELKKHEAIFRDLVEELPGAKQLTLSGRISRVDSPESVVKFILREKLGLSPPIVTAVRNSDLSITFQLNTVDDLLTVIAETNAKLNGSQVIKITYKK